jgi:hypothetical protein
MRRFPLKSLFGFVVLLALAVFLWRPVRQALAVAEVQRCAGHGAKVAFESRDFTGAKGTLPSRLPASVDSALKQMLTKHFKISSAEMRVLEQRFFSLFSDSIEVISVENPESDALGAALVRFPQLRSVVIAEWKRGMRADWSKLCAGLRQCRRLEQVAFSSPNLTDSGIAPLAGHPTLQVVIVGGHLTPACIETFKSMPSLRELTFNSVGHHLLDAERVAIKVALPSVNVKFSGYADFLSPMSDRK